MVHRSSVRTSHRTLDQPCCRPGTHSLWLRRERRVRRSGIRRRGRGKAPRCNVPAGVRRVLRSRESTPVDRPRVEGNDRAGRVRAPAIRGGRQYAAMPRGLHARVYATRRTHDSHLQSAVQGALCSGPPFCGDRLDSRVSACSGVRRESTVESGDHRTGNGEVRQSTTRPTLSESLVATAQSQSDMLVGRPFFRAADACRHCGSNCLRTGSGSVAIRVDHEC